MSKRRITVVAAEIEQAGRFLITQRRREASFPLLWEFPSGKVEPGEDDETALARELDERLGVQVEVGPQVLRVEREYDSYVIDFRVHSCRLLSDEIHRRRVADYRWVTVAELSDYEFPPADQHSVDQLLQG